MVEQFTKTIWFRPESNIIAEVDHKKRTMYAEDGPTNFAGEFKDEININRWMVKQGYEFIGVL